MERDRNRKRRIKTWVIVIISVFSALLLLLFSMRLVYMFHYQEADYDSIFEEHVGDWDGYYSSDTPAEQPILYAYQARAYAAEQIRSRYTHTGSEKGIQVYDVYYDEANEVWLVQRYSLEKKFSTVMGGTYWCAFDKEGRILALWGER